MMRTAMVGAAVGLVAGGTWVAYSRTSRPPPACPAGWAATPAPSVRTATLLVACSKPAAPPAAVPLVALYHSEHGAAAAPQIARDVARSRGLFAHAPAPAPEPLSVDGAGAAQGLSVQSRVDVREVPLEAEVYLVAAGRRFGLLAIVHAPEAPFAQPQTTAAWMSTISGAAPWGADETRPLQAHCPEGFQTLPPAEGSVVRCRTGEATSQFAQITLSVHQGGLGREEDRAQVATAIASRMAQSRGGVARLLEPPSPFTLARNVDAMRTRVATDERIPVSVHVISAFAPGGHPAVAGVAIGETAAQLVAPLGGLFDAGGYLSRPSMLRHRGLALAGAFALTALGAVAGALLGRRRTPD